MADAKIAQGWFGAMHKIIAAEGGTCLSQLTQSDLACPIDMAGLSQHQESCSRRFMLPCAECTIPLPTSPTLAECPQTIGRALPGPLGTLQLHRQAPVRPRLPGQGSVVAEPCSNPVY